MDARSYDLSRYAVLDVMTAAFSLAAFEFARDRPTRHMTRTATPGANGRRDKGSMAKKLTSILSQALKRVIPDSLSSFLSRLSGQAELEHFQQGPAGFEPGRHLRCTGLGARSRPKHLIRAHQKSTFHPGSSASYASLSCLSESDSINCL